MNRKILCWSLLGVLCIVLSACGARVAKGPTIMGRPINAIPEGSIVMLRTDWSFRWTDPNAFFAKDKQGQKHYPGWGKEALEYLVEKRKIRAIGHETPDTDSGVTCGVNKGWPLESYVLGKNLWQIEMLNNLDQLPPRDFLVFVGVPNAEKGTGFPVRVLAVLP